MRNRVLKVLAIIILMLMMIASINKVFAGQVVDVSVSAGSYGKNQAGQVETSPLTVTVKYPGRDAGNSVVTVKYSNNETETLGSTYNPSINEDGKVSFTPKSAGQATITVTSAVGYNNNGDPNSKVSYDNETKIVTVKDTSYVPPSPEPPKPPANNNTSNTIANTTNTTANNTVKPEVKNPTFKDVDETVYAVSNCNVRSSCSTEINDNKIGGLSKGQEVKRTGTSDKWSRIIYNGKTAYVYNTLLSKEKPEEPEENEVENEVVEDDFKNELDLLKEDIGVLPEVGTNIATVSFVGIAIISLAVVLIVRFRITKNEIDD